MEAGSSRKYGARERSNALATGYRCGRETDIDTSGVGVRNLNDVELQAQLPREQTRGLGLDQALADVHPDEDIRNEILRPTPRPPCRPIRG